MACLSLRDKFKRFELVYKAPATDRYGFCAVRKTARRPMHSSANVTDVLPGGGVLVSLLDEEEHALDRAWV